MLVPGISISDSSGMSTTLQRASSFGMTGLGIPLTGSMSAAEATIGFMNELQENSTTKKILL